LQFVNKVLDVVEINKDRFPLKYKYFWYSSTAIIYEPVNHIMYVGRFCDRSQLILAMREFLNKGLVHTQLKDWYLYTTEKSIEIGTSDDKKVVCPLMKIVLLNWVKKTEEWDIETDTEIKKCNYIVSEVHKINDGGKEGMTDIEIQLLHAVIYQSLKELECPDYLDSDEIFQVVLDKRGSQSWDEIKARVLDEKYKQPVIKVQIYGASNTNSSSDTSATQIARTTRNNKTNTGDSNTNKTPVVNKSSQGKSGTSSAGGTDKKSGDFPWAIATILVLLIVGGIAWYFWRQQ
jgi:CRISPR/Cas system CSM-associated protein Csm2 small subunit